MDLLPPGETTVNYELILQENDPALNPANRPPINDAIQMILGTANGFEVPFGRDHFSIFQIFEKHHADRAEQENADGQKEKSSHDGRQSTNQR